MTGTYPNDAPRRIQYLGSRDVDEVGDTLRTASLATDPEHSFDERNRAIRRLSEW